MFFLRSFLGKRASQSRTRLPVSSMRLTSASVPAASHRLTNLVPPSSTDSATVHKTCFGTRGQAFHCVEAAAEQLMDKFILDVSLVASPSGTLQIGSLLTP